MAGGIFKYSVSDDQYNVIQAKCVQAKTTKCLKMVTFFIHLQMETNNEMITVGHFYDVALNITFKTSICYSPSSKRYSLISIFIRDLWKKTVDMFLSICEFWDIA